MRNFLPVGEYCFSKFIVNLGHMTQCLHWTEIIFKNMFSILLSMVPHHEVTTFKVGDYNLWIDVFCFFLGVSLSLDFPFLSFLPSFLKFIKKIKSLHNSIGTSLAMSPI